MCIVIIHRRIRSSCPYRASGIRYTSGRTGPDRVRSECNRTARSSPHRTSRAPHAFGDRSATPSDRPDATPAATPLPWQRSARETHR